MMKTKYRPLSGGWMFAAVPTGAGTGLYMQNASPNQWAAFAVVFVILVLVFLGSGRRRA